ncbi:bifunctional adenosylcobinamide kinase/adenosylcobinamide-phosphate guanylyltransferase [Jeotgalibacillus proteolyticus]|uniref:bifunctional adenosylcobinamide kinase/adenosylcobinamide-phosphate guanylyltransferase n=1 Tax=Jeotgalibacillus proteolyticus TaxID=2082395 RepID=UPI003CF708FE
MAAGRMITVIGGVRSGKTTWAEQAALHRAREYNRRLVYLASGVGVDAEMRSRIERHQRDRSKDHWLTIEQPVNLIEAIDAINPNDVVVWDCLTTWLTNELIRHDHKDRLFSLMDEWTEWANCIKQKVDTLFIVSNEVLMEPVFTEGMTAVYQKKIGELHQAAVSISDIAIEMEAGLPLIRKGEWKD